MVSVRTPRGVSVIGGNAFINCSNLVTVTISSSVTTISAHAFANCPNLETLTLPSGLKRIEPYAFHLCRRLKRLTVPSTVRTLGARAFQGCTALREIRFTPSSRLELIDQAAFEQCDSLTAVCLPAVNTVEEAAFAHCNSLATVTVSSRHTAVGDGAFDGCPSLVCILLPSPLPASTELRDRFCGVPALRINGILGDSPGNRQRAVGIEYWRRRSHGQCDKASRDWVRTVLLVAHRVRRHGLHLPTEMWVAILEEIRRSELGSH